MGRGTIHAKRQESGEFLGRKGKQSYSRACGLPLRVVDRSLFSATKETKEGATVPRLLNNPRSHQDTLSRVFSPVLRGSIVLWSPGRAP